MDSKEYTSLACDLTEVRNSVHASKNIVDQLALLLSMKRDDQSKDVDLILIKLTSELETCRRENNELKDANKALEDKIKVLETQIADFGAPDDYDTPSVSATNKLLAVSDFKFLTKQVVDSENREA